MGWVARSLASGQGFSSPFFATTGPTALMPPLFHFAGADLPSVWYLHSEVSIGNFAARQPVLSTDVHPDLSKPKIGRRRTAGAVGGLALGNLPIRSLLLWSPGLGPLSSSHPAFGSPSGFICRIAFGNGLASALSTVSLPSRIPLFSPCSPSFF